MSEAAAHCGYKSRTVLYRLQRDGLLRDYEVGRHGRSLLLESNPVGRCSLREHIAACVQLRFDSPLAQRPRRPAAAAPLADLSDAELGAHCDQLMAGLDAALPSLDAAPDWERVAEHLNGFLGCSWPAPPWDGDQAATVAMALELALEGAAGG